MTHENEPGNNRRAVLWDVDGTLIDSSEYHWDSWRLALAAEDYPITRQQFDATFGQRNDEILRGYFGADFSDADVALVAEAKETAYRESIRTQGIELLPGVRRCLEELRSNGWRQAMASSAPRLNLEAIIESLNLRGYFDAIVSAEDVTNGKPDPQVFLIAAHRLEIDPCRCVVVEDAPAGVEAAHRAQMRVIGVLTSRAELNADLVVKRLDEIDVRAFERLLENP